VKETELFERWKSLQICKWEINVTEANTFKCNLPPISEKYVADVGMKTDVVTINPSIITERTTDTVHCPTDTILHILPTSIQSALLSCTYYPPPYTPHSSSVHTSHHHTLRTPLLYILPTTIHSALLSCTYYPPPYSLHSSPAHTTHQPTLRTPLLFQKLEKWRKPFYDVLQGFENASILLPAFYNTRNTDVSIRVKYVLDDFESQQSVYYFHPQYLINVSRFWLIQGVRAKRISSGLILVTAALELCDEVHLYGFWGFPMNPSGVFITHHYYDNVKPRPGFHAMPAEIFNFIHMHSKGILRVHTGTCS
ncbi:hypothetical protein AB205_0134670, partial [Aquarana catesbeiana]